MNTTSGHLNIIGRGFGRLQSFRDSDFFVENKYISQTYMADAEASCKGHGVRNTFAECLFYPRIFQSSRAVHDTYVAGK